MACRVCRGLKSGEWRLWLRLKVFDGITHLIHRELLRVVTHDAQTGVLVLHGPRLSDCFVADVADVADVAYKSGDSDTLTTPPLQG